VAKVWPSKDFLQQLCQILDAQLNYFYKKNSQNRHQLCLTLRKTNKKNYFGPQKKLFRPAKKNLYEIRSESKKVWPRLTYSYLPHSLEQHDSRPFNSLQVWYVLKLILGVIVNASVQSLTKLRPYSHETF
jgi:hypothetical protein